MGLGHSGHSFEKESMGQQRRLGDNTARHAVAHHPEWFGLILRKEETQACLPHHPAPRIQRIDAVCKEKYATPCVYLTP